MFALSATFVPQLLQLPPWARREAVIAEDIKNGHPRRKRGGG
jgi:hypothetical protein